MSLYAIKPRFQQMLRPAAGRLAAARVSPDWLTAGALVVAGMMGAALLGAARWRGWLWIAALGAVLRLTLNALDGEVARSLGRAGPWGEVKNELGDRLADALVFGALALAPYTSAAWGVPGLAVALLCGYTGILSKAVTGRRAYQGPLGKPDRMLALAVTCVLVALTGRWQLFTVFLTATTVLGALTVARRLEVTRESC